MDPQPAPVCEPASRGGLLKLGDFQFICFFTTLKNCRLHSQIEAVLVDLRQDFAGFKSGGTPDKETKKLQNQMKRKRRKIAKLLAQTYVWQCVGTDVAPASVALTKVGGSGGGGTERD